MRAERNPTTSEVVAALVSITGGRQEAVAEILGANQPDVSRWAKGGAMTGAVYQAARSLIAEFRDRRTWVERHLWDQVRDRVGRNGFEPVLIVETWSDTGDEKGRPSVFDRRRIRIDDPGAVGHFITKAAETVAREAIGYSAFFSGEFLVFRRPSADRVDVSDVRVYYLDRPLLLTGFTAEVDPFLGKIGGKK